MIKKHKGALAIFCAMLCVLLLFATTQVQSQTAQTIWSATLRGLFNIGDTGVIAPANSGKGKIGTNAKRVGSVVGDSIQANRFEIGQIVGGQASGSILMLVANNTGSSIAAGDFTVWDSTQIVVVDSTVSNVGAAATVADSLLRRAGKFTIVAEANGTPAADTVVVRGIKWGTSVTVLDSIILTDSAGSFSQLVDGTNRVYWTRIDSVSLVRVNGALSIQVEAIPFANVAPSASATTTFAGVAVGTIANADSGFVCIYGPVDGVVDAATSIGYPGKMIELSSGGDAVIDAAATTAQNVGRLLEFSSKDDWMTRVFITNY